MEILRNLNLAVAFLLEMAMLVIYGYFSYGLLPAETSMVNKVGTAILLPLIMAIIWGFNLAPRAENRLKMPWLLLAKVVIFGAGAVMLWWLGRTSLAIITAAVSAVHLGLSVIWKET